MDSREMVLKAFEMSTCNTNRFSDTVEHSTWRSVWITCSTPSGTLHPTWTGTNLGTTVCWASLQATCQSIIILGTTACIKVQATLATSRRNVSPEAIGRTPPCGLEKAYNVPYYIIPLRCKPRATGLYRGESLTRSKISLQLLGL